MGLGLWNIDLPEACIDQDPLTGALDQDTADRGHQVATLADPGRGLWDFLLEPPCRLQFDVAVSEEGHAHIARLP